MSWLRTGYSPHRDVDPGCAFPGCGSASDGALDGSPYCLSHADLVTERWAALSINENAARLLPALSDA